MGKLKRMKRVKFRSLKEIYDNCSPVLEPKIIPALEDRSPKRATDEADWMVQLNMASHGREERSESTHLSGSQFGMKKESMTCDVCAAPCSSFNCKHVASLRVPKSDEFSDEVYDGKDAKRCSSNEASLFSPSANSACNGRYRSSSETSNLLSACSSHDSFSEISESKDRFRVFSASEDMIVAAQIVADDCRLQEVCTFPDNPIVSDQIENQEESNPRVDNISCISSLYCMNVMVHDLNDDRGQKYLSNSLASSNCFPAIEKASNEQRASSCWGGDRFEKEDNDHPKKSDKSNQESSLGIAVFSNKSDLSEVSPLRDSCFGASSPMGELSHLSEEQVDSSPTRAAVVGIKGQMHNVNNFMESSQPDTDMAKGRLPEKCLDEKEYLEISVAVVEKPDVEEGPLCSQPIKCADRSDIQEDEVKICDICGDMGREDLLAVCSQCSDGAEHIYCMRVMLEKVPDANWMCEECMLANEAEKKKKAEVDKGAGTPELSSMKAIRQDSQCPSPFDCKNGSEFDNKKTWDQVLRKVEEKKVGSPPYFSTEGPKGGLAAVPVEKGTAFATGVKLLNVSRPLSQTPSSLYSSAKNMDKEKTKAANVSDLGGNSCKVPQVGDHSANHTPEKRKPAILQCSLLKSRSFNKIDIKGKDQPSKECSLHRQKFSGERHIKARSDKVSVSFPLADSGVSVSKSFVHLGEQELVKAHGKSSNPSSTHHPAQRVFPSEGQNIVVNKVKQHAAPSMHTKNSNMTGSPHGRPYLRDSCLVSSSVGIPSCAVPRPDYIWRGGFEVHRSGRLPSSWDGIQAHLSTCASHKVVEVVNQLPQKILLKEVSRINGWPTQFSENHATEDNIALYFFAKDLESYERNYKRLSECMIKNDLCLKGNLGGIQLLIFSSKMLPEKYQRWNGLYFLWGVFRGRMDTYLDQMPVSQNKIPSFSLNVAPMEQDMPASNLLGFQNALSSQQSRKRSPPFNLPYNIQKTSSSLNLPVSPDLTSNGGFQTHMKQRPGRENFHMRSEQLSCGTLHADTSQREEGGSNRRNEIDLNYCIEESAEQDSDGFRIDEERERKRMRSSGHAVYSSDRFVSAISGPLLDVSGEACKSQGTCSSGYGSGDDSAGFKSIHGQPPSSEGRDPLESAVPDLQLSLMVGSRMFGVQAKKDEHCKLVPTDENDNKLSLSLALSLAMPACPRK